MLASTVGVGLRSQAEISSDVAKSNKIGKVVLTVAIISFAALAATLVAASVMTALVATNILLGGIPFGVMLAVAIFAAGVFGTCGVGSSVYLHRIWYRQVELRAEAEIYERVTAPLVLSSFENLMKTGARKGSYITVETIVEGLDVYDGKFWADVMIVACLNSRNFPEALQLDEGKAVTKANCPPETRDLIDKLLDIKEQILALTPEQVTALRQKCGDITPKENDPKVDSIFFELVAMSMGREEVLNSKAHYRELVNRVVNHFADSD